MPGAAPPAGHDRRLSDADREQMVGLLREHYAQGRLDLDEMSRRVGVVLSAEFADEAAAAVNDLPLLARPPGPAAAQASPPARAAAAARAGARARAGWLPTSERFRDPATGKIMRVWVDPADQSRHYVPEPDGRARGWTRRQTEARHQPGGCQPRIRAMPASHRQHANAERPVRPISATVVGGHGGLPIGRGRDNPPVPGRPDHLAEVAQAGGPAGEPGPGTDRSIAASPAAPVPGRPYPPSGSQSHTGPAARGPAHWSLGRRMRSARACAAQVHHWHVEGAQVTQVTRRSFLKVAAATGAAATASSLIGPRAWAAPGFWKQPGATPGPRKRILLPG